MKKKMKMKYSITFAFIFFLGLGFTFAQTEDPKKAEKLYKKYAALAAEERENGEFAQAEALYRKALNKKPEGDEVAYNFGNLYFENEKKNQSAIRFVESAKASKDKSVKHKNFHNLGNLFMKEKDYAKAVEAYKDALRNNPNDEETRYNLALAKQQREKEKNDGDGGENKDQDQEQKKEDKNKDDNKGGEGDQEKKEGKKQDSKDGKDDKESEKKQDDAKQNPKEGENEKQQKPSEPKPQKGEMSEQQIKNLLQAIQNKEKDTQEKMNAKKAKGVIVKTEKDW